MKDKPTYWEYRFSNHDGYIKTKDGWYFKTDVSKAAKWVPTGLTMFLLLLFLGFYLLGISHNVSFSHSNSRLFDFFMFPMLLDAFEKRLEYRLIRYDLISEDSGDFETVKNIIYAPEWLRKALFVLAFPVWIFMAMNSNTTMLLYSAVSDSPAIIEATIDTSDQDPVSVMNSNTILLHSLSSGASMDITVTKAVYRASFHLNGEPCLVFDKISDFSFHFFWEKYYPRNEYNITLPEVPNNSVLTMDCGNLRREWTFKTGAE